MTNNDTPNMTAQSWQKHYDKKYQYSLRLFLLLTFISAVFSLVSPLYTPVSFTLPCVLIVILSAALALWHWKFSQRKINIPFISLIFGVLWASHITEKALLLPAPHFNFLVIALLSILFIGAIAFPNNITAFTLHSLPTFIACLFLAEGEQWLRMLYCLTLPIAGITLQNIIQKRSDAFTQGLMDKLLQERNTLNDLSMLDPLTGLYNRRGLQNRLDTLLAVSDSDHHVLLLDIDHFKAYNDHYGHMMGDQALIQVSAAIRNAVRSRDIVARFGGEEFMVLLTNSTTEAASLAAERIRQQVYDLKIPHMFNESVATNVTISIGMTPLMDSDIDGALKRADTALYEAKGQGRNIILAS
ncbi:diguanylate cyclase (GGDEF)-like protein [Raoultella planticola]|jgi:diguanylate cyclase (GGDEF)-like protein|uniref:diguanylate cyclase n=2 Tax=Raoultella planticola TaxID=575 RepID=A0A2X2G7D8_RAOPL|nr:putative membrane protein [Raoultella planticola ATCC 33531]TCL49948.1 diguanylate cyclase (GGDEF)-like protein [Raoultella planticola]TDV05930.1 diguanylate cyclase (GGDEF)-like protein [Raoultella planticola]TDX36096.1 diguanylate cyclase (GGDEF)-like protein [Raoultella planticola]SPZ27530.1 Probable diguanylate cyclase AdrA [Raoultella planticola]